MWLEHTVDSSFLFTSRSNRRMIIFVREIGLSWLLELSSSSVGAGLIFASIHDSGTVCCRREALNTSVIAGPGGTQSQERASRGDHQGPRQSF